MIEKCTLELIFLLQLWFILRESHLRACDVSKLIFPGEEESFGSSLVNEIVNCDDKDPSVVQSDISSATLVQGDQKAREVKNDCAEKNPTSRKRLSKEYEQLAIWFGDVDMGPVHDHFQTLWPSSSTATSEPKNTQTELVCDSTGNSFNHITKLY